MIAGARVKRRISATGSALKPAWDVDAKRTEAVPLLRPQPPRLSEHTHALRQLELSGTYSNFGPINTQFERALIEKVFGTGHCLTTCNATLGLMIAMRSVIDETPGERRYALMPSFTFAATAQAALWCGLTPLLCDINPETWLPCREDEERLLQAYHGRIAVVVPYATFGNNLDLQRYQQLSERYEVPIVVDAAASLGSLDEQGRAFGSGFAWPVVFSMHATKAFSVGEGGIVYSADAAQVEAMRTMASFGFGNPRSATMPGLNAKLSEVAALAACVQLEEFRGMVQHRETVARWYARALQGSGMGLQQTCGLRQVRAFQPVVLPSALRPFRELVMQGMERREIGVGKYFSPHLAEQPYLRRHTVCSELPVTDDIASRILSLPLLPDMQQHEVARVIEVFSETVTELSRSLC